MKLGVALGMDLDLSAEERFDLVHEAALFGYDSAWRNAQGIDAIEELERWNQELGIATGVNVIPTQSVDVHRLATAARHLSEQSGGRFILGIGSGSLNAGSPRKPLATMREHLEAFRQSAGAPVYLAAMGPQMLRLAGRLANGVLPNWMEPRQLEWAREQIAAGARAAGRDPRSIPIAQYVRVSVDGDRAVARQALAKNALGYALARPGIPGGGQYRRAMARMGLDEQLTEIERLRDAGVDKDALAAALPDSALERLGAWGTADEVLPMARRLAQGLDTAIVRIVQARPGVEAVRAVIAACAPANWKPNAN